ncbi:hypothetical protein [Seonamhaeicola maritimus]|uniref:hypothetical protein n=1 Tax=Seonamhaeicola maritimus TaxID=2591822 RepID=UPI002494D6BB|nr:hypothetical protein [Seonamhaeicola maritimus]
MIEIEEPKKFYVSIGAFLLLVAFLIFIPFWLAYILVLIVSVTYAFYHLKNDNEERITLSHLYERRVYQKDNFDWIQLENKLNRKSVKLYQIYFVLGVILTLISCYVFTKLINLFLVDVLVDVFSVNFFRSIGGLFGTTMGMFIACLGMLFGNISFISGFYMIPLIGEYKKYQFSLELLSNENDMEAKEKIKKGRDEWFENNKEIINMYFDNVSYLDMFAYYFK